MRTMCMLQKQHDYYQRNRSSLLQDYHGKHLVISENLDIKAFDTLTEAYKYGCHTYGLGNFLLQECTEEADSVQIISNLGLRTA